MAVALCVLGGVLMAASAWLAPPLLLAFAGAAAALFGLFGVDVGGDR